MSKLIDSTGKLWYEQTGTYIAIGLTNSFLSTLDECWHILPANTSKIRKKAPLFSVETNDALISVLSPIEGNFLLWSSKAANFPDKLTELDVIMQLTTDTLPEVEETPTARQTMQNVVDHRAFLNDLGLLHTGNNNPLQWDQAALPISATQATNRTHILAQPTPRYVRVDTMGVNTVAVPEQFRDF